MFEVFATITDDAGTRTVPTGKRTFSEGYAYEVLEKLRRYRPEHRYHVEWVPASDEWNCY